MYFCTRHESNVFVFRESEKRTKEKTGKEKKRKENFGKNGLKKGKGKGEVKCYHTTERNVKSMNKSNQVLSTK